MRFFRRKQADPPGFYEGKHYTEHVAAVDQLIRANDLLAATALLLNLVSAVEAEDAAELLGVAPWYYERLAVVYHGQGDAAGEVAILERFARQRRASGTATQKLLKRLEQAKERLRTQT